MLVCIFSSLIIFFFCLLENFLQIIKIVVEVVILISLDVINRWRHAPTFENALSSNFKLGELLNFGMVAPVSIDQPIDSLLFNHESNCHSEERKVELILNHFSMVFPEAAKEDVKVIEVNLFNHIFVCSFILSHQLLSILL